MSAEPQFTGWQAIQAEVLRRIHAREWPPGQVIPGEVALAAEFGCARATVNRALQALAEAGMLERRRKAGTRVALHPVSKATVTISLIRQEIEARGATYGYRLLRRQEGVHALLTGRALHVTALHFADDAAFVLEDRHIDLTVIPLARNETFQEISANEWLLRNAPYTSGDVAFSAQAASAEVAQHLGAETGAPIFVMDRMTWDGEAAITAVRLFYAPGYRIRTVIGGS
jgi:GntR family histidine utilization transcriptional repressor